MKIMQAHHNFLRDLLHQRVEPKTEENRKDKSKRQELVRQIDNFLDIHDIDIEAQPEWCN